MEYKGIKDIEDAILSYIEHHKRRHIDELTYLNEHSDYQPTQHQSCIEEQERYIKICEAIEDLIIKGDLY